MIAAPLQSGFRPAAALRRPRFPSPFGAMGTCAPPPIGTTWAKLLTKANKKVAYWETQSGTKAEQNLAEWKKKQAEAAKNFACQYPAGPGVVQGLEGGTVPVSRGAGGRAVPRQATVPLLGIGLGGVALVLLGAWALWPRRRA